MTGSFDEDGFVVQRVGGQVAQGGLQGPLQDPTPASRARPR